MTDLFYLKPNIQAEPAINKWYAWSMLLSPATFALVTKNLHIKIMESYLKSPKMHAQAVKNPAMRGGPFMDFLGAEPIAEVEKLLEFTKNDLSRYLELANGISTLEAMLKSAGDGFSMIPLYAKIPECLRGYVELVYDLNNNPSFRLLESLMYHSDYYDPSLQSISFTTLDSDERPFVLSTPRLNLDNELVLQTNFSNPVIDDIFKSKTNGLSRSKLDAIYDEHFAGQSKQDFENLFISGRANPDDNPESNFKGNGVRLRYFGHACVLMETQNTCVLIDPIISYSYSGEVSKLTFADLPDEIDYILLTHNHQDHVLFETLLQLRHKTKYIVAPRNTSGALQDPSLKIILSKLGFDNVIELEEMDRISFADGEIIGLPFFGEHGDLNIQSKLAFCVQMQDKRALFAADSNNIEPMLYQHLQKIIPNLDAIFIGMECEGAPMSWLYGPLQSNPVNRSQDQSRRLNGSDANRAMELIKSFSGKQVYIYAMGQEPWLSYITSIWYTEESPPIVESNKLMQMCKQQNIFAKRLFGKEIIDL